MSTLKDSLIEKQKSLKAPKFSIKKLEDDIGSASVSLSVMDE